MTEICNGVELALVPRFGSQPSDKIFIDTDEFTLDQQVENGKSGTIYKVVAELPACSLPEGIDLSFSRRVIVRCFSTDGVIVLGTVRIPARVVAIPQINGVVLRLSVSSKTPLL